MIVTRSRTVAKVAPSALYLYGVNEQNQTVAVPGGPLVAVPNADPSGRSDSAPAIIEAVNAASAAGGGTLVLGTGTFLLGSEVQIPPYVNLKGSGLGATTLKSTGASGRLNFIRGSSDGRGGESGHFTLNGNHVGTDLLKMGVCVERTFSSIDINQSDGTGLLLEGAQNCTFVNVASQNNNGSNVVIDYGSGNNRFISCEVSKAGAWNIRFQQSGTSPSGAFNVPSGNRFIGSIVKRLGWNDGPVDPDNGAGLIYHGAGRYNGFHYCDIALEGLTAAKTMVVIEKAGSDDSLLFEFSNITWSGTATHSTAVEVRANTTAVFNGRHLFENHNRAFSIADSGIVYGNFEPTLGSVTTYFHNYGGGTQPQVNRMQTTIRSRHRVQVPLDTVASVVQVDGDTFDSTEIYPSGILRGGGGSSATDVEMARQSAYSILGWKMTTPARTETSYVLSLGPIDVIVASGVPNQSAPNGSLYLRTDNNGQLYQRRSGSWTSI